MLCFFRDMSKSQEGATAIEYGLIAALMAIAMIVAFENFAEGSDAIWNKVETKTVEATKK
jgi:pilus assembly protein Flp/PilA